jgi:hypothetical protein
LDEGKPRRQKNTLTFDTLNDKEIPEEYRKMFMGRVFLFFCIYARQARFYAAFKHFLVKQIETLHVQDFRPVYFQIIRFFVHFFEGFTMKPIVRLWILIGSIGLVSMSCSSGVVTSTMTALYEPIPHEQVQHIERTIKLRLQTPLPYTVDLRQQIKAIARQKGVNILYDETYWLLWAQDKFAAYMNPSARHNGLTEAMR